MHTHIKPLPHKLPHYDRETKPPPEAPGEIPQKVRVDVWADGRPGRDKTAYLVVVKLRPEAKAPNVKQ